MKNKKRQWRNILIDPDFQLRLMSYFVGLFVITTLSLYSTTYLFFYKLVQKGMRVGIPAGHVFYKFLEEQKSELDWLFVGLALFNLVLLLGVGFIISHRIAGPIYKLKNYLSGMSSQSGPFSLRKKDFLKDLEPVVSSVREKIK
jgi:sensor histidine kinase YesM